MNLIESINEEHQFRPRTFNGKIDSVEKLIAPGVEEQKAVMTIKRAI